MVAQKDAELIMFAQTGFGAKIWFFDITRCKIKAYLKLYFIEIIL